MSQFNSLEDLNQTFVSMNNKVKLTEKETEEIYSKIKEKMNDIPQEPKKSPIQWKYYIASAAVVLLLIVMTIPLLNNNGKELVGGNEQSPSSNHSDSNPLTTDTREAEIVIKIINNTDFGYPQMELNVYQNGELKATQGSMNADGSPVEKGDYFEFTFTKNELAGQVTLEAVIIDPIPKKGRTLFSAEKLTLNVTDDKEYFFEIIGSPPSNVNLQNIDQDISIESNKKKDTFDANIQKEENELAAMVQEKLTLGLRKEQVESLLGEHYYEGISNIDGREFTRYDLGNEKYQFTNDDGEMGDTEALLSDKLKAQVFLYWDEEGKLEAFSVLFLNQKEGKVYLYYLLSDGSSGKSEVQVEE